MLKTIVFFVFAHIVIFNYSVFSMIQGEEKKPVYFHLPDKYFVKGEMGILTISEAKKILSQIDFLMGTRFIENKQEIVKNYMLEVMCDDSSRKSLNILEEDIVIYGQWNEL